ncbi:hypothetical protein WMF31_05445 [Sorangium sp. So ce1036]|uniref:hypothetical protein n=1 Tax=Sorangium sp. So ce1036 TaxID=3133328 RepID=UPI003EFCE76F
MSKRVVSRLAALGITVVWASLMVPGCTITFSPGTGDDTDVGTPGGAEDNPTGGAEDNPTGGTEGNPIGGDAAGDEPEEPMTEEESGSRRSTRPRCRWIPSHGRSAWINSGVTTTSCVPIGSRPSGTNVT